MVSYNSELQFPGRLVSGSWQTSPLYHIGTKLNNRKQRIAFHIVVVRDLHGFLMVGLNFQSLHRPLPMAKKTKAPGKQGQTSPWSLWVCLGELEGVEKRTGSIY